MNKQSRFMASSVRVTVAALCFSLLAFHSAPAWARGGSGHSGGGGHGGGHSEVESHGSGGRHGGEGSESHGGRHGSITRHLPDGYREISHRGERFFFHDGRFFSSHRDGFINVAGPIGIRVPILPAEAVRLDHGGATYRIVDDNYYRRTDNGYIVVDSPYR